MMHRFSCTSALFLTITATSPLARGDDYAACVQKREKAREDAEKKNNNFSYMNELMASSGQTPLSWTSTGSQTNEPVPGVNPALTPPAVAKVTAGITGQQSGTVFRATVAPLQFLDEPESIPATMLQELQASVATDTSTAGGAKTTFAVATNVLDPFSPQGEWFARANDRCACRFAEEEHKDERACFDKKAQKISGCYAAIPVQLDELCPVQTEAVCPPQRAPAAADAAQPGAPEADDAHAACVGNLTALHESCRATENKRLGAACAADVTTAARADEDKCLKDKLTSLGRKVGACQWHELPTAWPPQIQASGAVAAFPGGYYTDPAGKNNGLLLPWGGVSAQLTFAFRPAERLSFSAWGSYQSTRSGAVPGTFLADYLGWAAQVSWLAFPFLSVDTFLDSKGAKESKNAMLDTYIKTGYLPGIAMGLSGQLLRCIDAAPICAQGLLTQWSVTPFVDTRISPAVQLRLSVQVNQGPVADSSALGVVPSIAAASSM